MGLVPSPREAQRRTRPCTFERVSPAARTLWLAAPLVAGIFTRAAAGRVFMPKSVAPATRQTARAAGAAVAPGLTLAVLTSACHEELGVQPGPAKERVEVASLDLEGVHALDEGRVRAALETEESSWLPWGEKAYFDRATFDEDLKRIQAFYEDHGYPHARIAETDVRLEEKDGAVQIRIVLLEGEPVRVAELAFSGFAPLAPDLLQEARPGEHRRRARRSPAARPRPAAAATPLPRLPPAPDSRDRGARGCGPR